MNKINFKTLASFILLETSFIILSLSTVFVKTAAGYPFLSERFLWFLALSLFLLVIYALMWQQVLKRLSLTVAYTNRSILYFWLLLWSVIFFGASITLNNLIGLTLVISGIIMASRES